MPRMELTGQKFQKLQEALLSAFVSESKLKQMVQYELNKNLLEIAGGQNLTDLVFELIRWAESHGKVEELVRGARQQNPGNKKLKAFAHECLTKSSQKPIEASIPLQLPPPVEHFTGREEELKQLLAALELGQVVTLCGAGGIGKSALASEALWRLAADNTVPDIFPDGIIYHDFYAHPQTTLALEEIIRAFGLDLIEGLPALAAKRVLAGRQALLVLDGAEQADDLGAVLDVRNGCGVLITTRDGKHTYGKRLEISSLPDHKAVSLLQAWGKEHAKDEVSAREICKLVGGLPLAVRLVGHYLDYAKWYADEYLEWLEETPLEALDHGLRQLESVPLLLEKSLNKVSLSARQVLAVVGMLAFAPFEKEVVCAVLGLKSYQAVQPLGELVNYGLLVRREEDKRYEVSHALVHTYARECLAITDKNEARFINYFFQKAQEAANQEGFPRSSRDTFEVIDQLYPHILKALEKLKERYVKERNTARQQMINFVEALDKYWQVHNQYQAQLKWVEEAYHCASILEKDKNKLDNLEGLRHIYRARILYLQGDLKEAKLNCLYGMNIIKDTGQIEVVAEGHNLLGSIYGRSGEYEAALTSLQRSVAIWQEVGNEFKKYRTKNNISTIYFMKGNVIKAKKIDERCLRYWSRFGNQSQLTVILNNFGFLCYTLGECQTMAGLFKEAATDYQEAIKHHHQAAEISQRLSLPKELVLAKMNRAWAHIGLKEWNEAASHLSNSLEIQKRYNITVYSVETYRALAEVAIGQGDFNKALASAEKAFKKAQGEDKAEEGAANRVLGKAYRLSGELDKAEKYLKISLSELQAINNPFETALTWRELALLYDKQGQEQEAQEAEAQVQAILVQMGIILEEQ